MVNYSEVIVYEPRQIFCSLTLKEVGEKITGRGSLCKELGLYDF